MTGTIPVLAMPMLDPGAGRLSVSAPEGSTIAEVIALALPAALGHVLDRCRVGMARDDQAWIVDRRYWHCVRPKTGTQVFIRLLPGDTDLLRNALLIAVTIGATALGQVWAGPAIAGLIGGSLGGTLGGIGGSLVTAGLIAGGAFLINTLLPPSGGSAEKPTFAISAWQNSANPDGPTPILFGTHRCAPPYAAPPYLEIVGDQQYIRAVFACGIGPTWMTDLKLGSTPLEKFTGVDTEIRYGFADDTPITLYPEQVYQESIGAELRRDRPRDETGKIDTGGAAVEAPVIRVSATDANDACVIFYMPAGLGKGNGSKIDNATVAVRIRERLIGELAWTEVATLNLKAAKREGFFRAYRWTLPGRGQYEVECTRMTAESTDTAVSDRVTWQVLQTFRPESPLNYSIPVALVAMRIKATYQLNGTVDTFNFLGSRIAEVWDGHDWVTPVYDAMAETWTPALSSNPAVALRSALTGPNNAYPVAPDVLGTSIEDFHEFCADNGLNFDRVFDFDISRNDAVMQICAAGRAKPTKLAGKWEVIIDRARELVVAHLNDRNAWEVSGTRSFHVAPDAYRIPFLDASANYESRECIVLNPDFVGSDPTIIEELTAPGQTSYAAVWRSGQRRFLELKYRPEVWTATQDGAVRTATRGDLVKATLLDLDDDNRGGYVTAVRGRTLSLDSVVSMTEGQSYAIRYFVYPAAEGAPFTSVLASVVTVPGEHDAVTVAGLGDLPAAGSQFQFGRTSEMSVDLIVSEVTAGENLTSVLRLFPAAPEIDEQLALLVPPAFNGRVGAILPPDMTPPEAPLVTSVETFFDASHASKGLAVLLAPAIDEPLVIVSYVVRHRKSGDVVWATTAGDSAIELITYAPSDVVEFQAAAVSLAGVQGAWGDLVSRLVYDTTTPIMFDFTITANLALAA